MCLLYTHLHDLCLLFLNYFKPGPPATEVIIYCERAVLSVPHRLGRYVVSSAEDMHRSIRIVKRGSCWLVAVYLSYILSYNLPVHSRREIESAAVAYCAIRSLALRCSAIIPQDMD